MVMPKKIMIAAGICLLSPFVVFAAKSVQGTVPKQEPLQPPPAYVYPNLSGNIQERSGSANSQFVTSSNSSDYKQDMKPGADQAEPAAVSSVVKTNTRSALRLWPIYLVLLAGFFWWLTRQHKST